MNGVEKCQGQTKKPVGLEKFELRRYFADVVFMVDVQLLDVVKTVFRLHQTLHQTLYLMLVWCDRRKF